MILGRTCAFLHIAAEGAHLGNLGIAHTKLGDPRRAIEFFEQVLAIVSETGGHARRRWLRVGAGG